MYRNPGLHFGDIHRLKAVLVEALKEIVGNAKYGIFFSINGPRSVGSEIANGDFDGDEYWVSSNPEVKVYTSFYFSVLSLFHVCLESLSRQRGEINSFPNIINSRNKKILLSKKVYGMC